MRRRWRRSILGPLFAALIGSLPFATSAQSADPQPVAQQPSAESAGTATRNGREIYRRFREGLADPECRPGASTRWRAHFATTPARLASSRDDVLPLFGYVVDALRDAHLPTEYALIPFVESGYQPGARSPLGPAGLWQMIKLTARAHHVPIGNGYDGRLSPVDSTKAAVRYLKTLHGMFAGDWRLAAMAYNAGEYRIFGALKRAGQVARDAQPEKLPGLAGITHAYVRKLHALSCLLEQAEDHDEWLRAIDRPVPRLEAVAVPAGVRHIDDWAAGHHQDAGQLRRLNPAFVGGKLGRGPVHLLAVPTGVDEPTLVSAVTDAPSPGHGGPAVEEAPPVGPRRHTIVRGDSAGAIAQRYGVSLGELLQRNALKPGSLLRPGRVLQIDPPLPADE